MLYGFIIEYLLVLAPKVTQYCCVRCTFGVLHNPFFTVPLLSIHNYVSVTTLISVLAFAPKNLPPSFPEIQQIFLGVTLELSMLLNLQVFLQQLKRHRHI